MAQAGGLNSPAGTDEASAQGALNRLQEMMMNGQIIIITLLRESWWCRSGGWGVAWTHITNYPANLTVPRHTQYNVRRRFKSNRVERSWFTTECITAWVWLAVITRSSWRETGNWAWKKCVVLLYGIYIHTELINEEAARRGVWLSLSVNFFP